MKCPFWKQSRCTRWNHRAYCARLDRHFHDCDEFWIVLNGRATVSSEDKIYNVGPGDCVATGRGWQHDILRCDPATEFRAIWLETELEGQRRTGHLREPLDGPCSPCLDRV